MSAIPAQEPIRIKYAAPSGNNVEVVCKDDITGLDFEQLTRDNVLIRAVWNPGNSDNVGYLIFKRGRKEVRRIPTSLMGATLQGPVWVGFPLPIRAGIIQLYYEQTAGTAAAGTFDLVFEGDL